MKSSFKHTDNFGTTFVEHANFADYYISNVNDGWIYAKAVVLLLSVRDLYKSMNSKQCTIFATLMNVSSNYFWKTF